MHVDVTITGFDQVNFTIIAGDVAPSHRGSRTARPCTVRAIMACWHDVAASPGPVAGAAAKPWPRSDSDTRDDHQWALSGVTALIRVMFRVWAAQPRWASLRLQSVKISFGRVANTAGPQPILLYYISPGHKCCGGQQEYAPQSLCYHRIENIKLSALLGQVVPSTWIFLKVEPPRQLGPQVNASAMTMTGLSTTILSF